MMVVLRRMVGVLLGLTGMMPAVAQRELLFARDPAAIRSDEIRITHYNLPAIPSRYATLRFVDVRPVRAFCGFIRPALQLPARKLATPPGLEEQLSRAIPIRKDSASLPDTLLVVLKNFWLYRSLTDDHLMYCRVHALFFSSRGDSVRYYAKADTLLQRRAVVRYEYRELPALFLEDLMKCLPPQPEPVKRLLSREQFQQQATNWLQPPVLAGKPDGWYLSFGDFMKGRLLPADFVMREFGEDYLLHFGDEEQRNRYSGKIWGALFKGGLYLRNGRHFGRAFPAEQSYFLLNNIRNQDGEFGYSYPLLLNMENGRLE